MSYNEQLRCDYLTTNHEGAKAWRMTPEWELYSTVVTMMDVEDKFYEDGESRVRRVADLVRKTSPEFVASLAVYTREKMHLRSVPLLLLVELARCHHGDSLVSRAVARCVQRVDEISELLMCYQWRIGRNDLKKLSSQLRKGLAEAFNHFDEYQFAKYDRKNRKVMLRDALLLVHPKPKDDAQAALFKKILNDSLEIPYTWETELSSVGKVHFQSQDEKDEAIKDSWQELVASGRLGYMATLRNLRNMCDLTIDDQTMRQICRTLSNPLEVERSRQLPFRFLSAYLQLMNVRESITIRYYPKLDLWAQNSYARLEQKSYEIKDKLRNLQMGRFFIKKPKVCRYSLLRCLAYNSTIRGGIQMKKPKLHARKWIKAEHRFAQFRSRDQKQLIKLERMLQNIEKRMSVLTPFVEKEQRLLNKEWDKAEKVAAYRNAARKKELQRVDRRLKKLGISWQNYVDPLLSSLEEAVRHSAGNIAGFETDTRVLLASDTSGSMCGPVSQNSSVMCYHIGIMLSMLMKNRCKSAVTGMFGDVWKTFDMPSDNILQNTVDMISRAGEVGCSTNGYKIIDWLIQENRVMDKVMLFTDCQLWNSSYNDAHIAHSWECYKAIAPHARLYIFDLAGYGQSPVSMKRDDVFCIAGWSDKVFDILTALERGESAIDEIRRIVV